MNRMKRNQQLHDEAVARVLAVGRELDRKMGFAQADELAALRAENDALRTAVAEARGIIDMVVLGAPTLDIALTRAATWLAAHPEPGQDAEGKDK